MNEVRLIFKSGHVEVLGVEDDADVKWKFTGNKLTSLEISSIKHNRGSFINLDEVAAFFVLDRT